MIPECRGRGAPPVASEAADKCWGRSTRLLGGSTRLLGEEYQAAGGGVPGCWGRRTRLLGEEYQAAGGGVPGCWGRSVRLLGEYLAGEYGW